MPQSILSRKSLVMLLSSTVLLSACNEVGRVYDRAYQGVDGAYDSMFSSSKKPQVSPTKVEVTTPVAAPYLDVKANEVQNAASPANTAQPVELGAMRDAEPLSVAAQSAAPEVAQPAITRKINSPLAAPKAAAPVAEKAAAPALPTPPAATASVDTLGSPVMVVRFNQGHVYYDDALIKVVNAAEKARPGASYSVVSRLPDLSTLTADQQANIATRSSENLRDVVAIIQQQGVAASRIKIANQKAPVKSQEIAVFVN